MEPDPSLDPEHKADPSKADSEDGAQSQPGCQRPRGLGEPYTSMPEFRRRSRRRWLYWLFAGALALASAAATLVSRRSASPSQPGPTTAAPR